MIHSPLASRSATRALLETYGLSTKKALGQHFLVEDGVIGRILELAGVGADDVVLEVGPGIGTLTVALLPVSAGVVAIERDHDLPPILSEVTRDFSEKFVLIEGDALAVGEEDLLAAAERIGDDDVVRTPCVLVSNLPYAVAATIILDYFERFDFLESATVMVQSEVADRIAAQPGTKDYGSYTVKLRLLTEVTGRFQVSPGNFFPPPRVDSAVVRLQRCDRGVSDSGGLLRAAATAADAAFAQRRKNIRNSMTAYLGSKGVAKDVVDVALERAEIVPTRRGETLSVEEYLTLGQALLDAGARF